MTALVKAVEKSFSVNSIVRDSSQDPVVSILPKMKDYSSSSYRYNENEFINYISHLQLGRQPRLRCYQKLFDVKWRIGSKLQNNKY